LQRTLRTPNQVNFSSKLDKNFTQNYLYATLNFKKTCFLSLALPDAALEELGSAASEFSMTRTLLSLLRGERAPATERLLNFASTQNSIYPEYLSGVLQLQDVPSK